MLSLFLAGWARKHPPAAFFTAALIYLSLAAGAAVATAAVASAFICCCCWGGCFFAVATALLVSKGVSIVVGTANASVSVVIASVTAASHLPVSTATADGTEPPGLRRSLRFSTHADVLFSWLPPLRVIWALAAPSTDTEGLAHRRSWLMTGRWTRRLLRRHMFRERVLPNHQ